MNERGIDHGQEQRVAWEFVAISRDDGEEFCWRWRRIADDAALILEESIGFSDLESCIHDARKHGFPDVTEGPAQF